MEDNKDMASSTETEQKENSEAVTQNTETERKIKTYTRDEVNKMMNAEKLKIKQELEAEFSAKQTEAEKLAKMDVEQKLKYQLEESNKALELERAKNNSLTLSNEAKTYAGSKGLPLAYIEDWDFSKESADSVKTKIDKLSELRSKDLEEYMNSKFKQSAPKAVDESKEKVDPYLQGYKNYKKKV